MVNIFRPRIRDISAVVAPPPPVVTPPSGGNATVKPAQVTNLVSGAVTGTTVVLSWTPDPNASSYYFEYQHPGDSYWTLYDRLPEPTGPEIKIVRLSPNNAYSFRVFGKNSLGVSPIPSTILNFSTGNLVSGEVAPTTEGMNQTARPTIAIRTGRPKAGSFDVFAYDWNKVGRTSTAPLRQITSGTTSYTIQPEVTLSDVSTAFSQNASIKLSSKSKLVESQIISTVSGGGISTGYQAADAGLIQKCSFEVGEIAIKMNGPLRVDHCYLVSAMDAWRPISRNGAEPQASYTLFYGPNARGFNADGTKNNLHPDGIQSWAITNGATIYRCVFSGFTTGLINTTAETDPVTGLLVQECLFEADVPNFIINYGSKFNGTAPTQAATSTSMGPGNPTWCTYKDCLIGSLRKKEAGGGRSFIGFDYILGSEAERDAMHAAGASAIVYTTAKDPKTGKSIVGPDGKGVKVVSRLVPAAQFLVMDNIRYAGNKLLDDTPDQDGKSPGELYNFGSAMYSWPPQSLADGTQWWTYDKPKFNHAFKSVKFPVFTAPGTIDINIEWADPAVSNDYETYFSLSNYNNGKMYPELVSSSRTGCVIRITALEASTAVAASQHQLNTRYMEYRPGDIPEKPTRPLPHPSTVFNP